MKLNSFRKLFVPAGCAALLCAAPLLATQAQPASSQADRYLMEIDGYAQTIQSHAVKLERLTQDPYATWQRYDEQWNEIKPAQEALQNRIWRLESMRASLTDSQKKMLADDKVAAQRIAWRTKQLLNFLDEPGADLKSPELRTYARALARNAGTVVQNTRIGA